MVTGDFDLSGIGTVTHVEGDRVYGFGHPMFSLGACEFPMMTGYIHTVYPRASVSMKMGSPLKVVGVVDTDVSTGVAGRVGPKPDMIPLSVRVKTGRYSEPAHLQRPDRPRAEPAANLVMAVLTNAIDTEGNLPEELTARIKATIKLKGHDPIELDDTLSGPRYTGPMGPAALFSPIASIVNILVRNPMAPIRIESIDCDVEIRRAGRWPRSSRSGSPPTGSSRGDAQGVRHAEAVQGRAADHRGDPAAARRLARRDVRGDLLRPDQQPAPPVPQRARAARAARPGRGHRGDPAPDRPKRTRPLPARPSARPRARRQGAGPAQPAGERPGGLRHGRQSQEPPVRTDLIEAVDDALGGRRDAVAQVHRRQGHRAFRSSDRFGSEPGLRPTQCRRAIRNAASSVSDWRRRSQQAVAPGGFDRPRSAAPGAWPAVLAKLETWRQERASAFAKGHREHVVVSDSGRVRLGQALESPRDARRRPGLGPGRTPNGELYAATGDVGKVFRREGKDERLDRRLRRKDTQALALAVLADGHVVVGTGPSGQVVDVTDPKHPGLAPDPGVQYIWDLATDPKGNLYAATGPTGQLWKRSADGKWSLLLDSKHSHLLCVAVGPTARSTPAATARG